MFYKPFLNLGSLWYPGFSYFTLFHPISPVTRGIFHFFKHMSLRYFFETILIVAPDSCYNLKSPPYAPVLYVQNIKMCIHSERVRISTFTNISTFSRLSFQIEEMVLTSLCYDSKWALLAIYLWNLKIFKGRGASCATTCLF